MTPERIKELKAHSKYHEDHAHVNIREVGMEPFTWGELRWLLNTAARRENCATSALEGDDSV